MVKMHHADLGLVRVIREMRVDSASPISGGGFSLLGEVIREDYVYDTEIRNLLPYDPTDRCYEADLFGGCATPELCRSRSACIAWLHYDTGEQ